jgi:excinuclease UvrABC helicase subunit UvrB
VQTAASGASATGVAAFGAAGTVAASGAPSGASGDLSRADAEATVEYLPPRELKRRIDALRKQMKETAARLEFERASELRDEMLELEKRLVEMGG